MVDLLNDVQSTAIQREMVPVVQYVLLYSLKTLFGMDSMNALPPLLFSDEALMRLVGFNAQQVRQGVCQRGAATRQGPRTTGPICPDTLAENIVQLNVRDLEALFNGVIRALAKGGVFAAKVTGIVDATDLETTAQYEGCGQVTRKRKVTDKRGKVHEIEVTVYGFKLIVLIEARTKIPLAATVVPIQEHEMLSTAGPGDAGADQSGGSCPPAQGGLRQGVFGWGGSVVAGRSMGSSLWCRPRTTWR